MFTDFPSFNLFTLPVFERFVMASPKLLATRFRRLRARGRPVAVDRCKAAKLRAKRRAKRLGQA